MISPLRNEQVAVFAKQTAQRALVNYAVVFQPKQAEDIRIAVKKQPDEFPELIEDAIPFAFPFFVYVLPAKSQIVLNRRDVNTHHVFVVDRIRIGLWHVHAVRHTAAPTERYQSFG